MPTRQQPPKAVYAAILLACLMAAFIVYGSLYPFRFRLPPAQLGPADLFAAVWRFQRPSRGDLAANLLLYAPLGLALAVALAARMRAAAAAALALLACILLSAAMETAQIFVPRRSASGWDLVLNAIGAAAGAIAGALLAPARAGEVLGWRPRLAEAFPAVLLACWLAYRLYPYVPALDLGEWRSSLRPLLPPWDPDPLRTLRLAILWLVAARLLDAARPRGEAGLLLALLMAGTLAAAVPIVDRRVTPEEAIAVAIALPAWLLLRGRGWADRLLLPLLLAAVLLEGAQPYRFLAEPRPFGWIPLRSVMAGHWGNGLQALLYKFFLYGGLVWLGLRAGLRLPLAAALSVATALGVSVLQTWLPGRSAEITDALVAAAAALTLRVLLHRSVPVGPLAAAGRPP